jgi:hypothetical protein
LFALNAFCSTTHQDYSAFCNYDDKKSSMVTEKKKKGKKEKKKALQDIFYACCK